MDAAKANVLAYTIKYAKAELQEEPKNALINITLKREDFKEILKIAEIEVNKCGGATILV